MINALNSHKFLFTLVVVAMVALVMYNTAPTSSNSLLVAPSMDIGDNKLASTILSLETINISTVIFKDPTFRALVDFSMPIVSEGMGRPNPFAPLGAGDAVATSSQTKMSTSTSVSKPQKQ